MKHRSARRGLAVALALTFVGTAVGWHTDHSDHDGAASHLETAHGGHGDMVLLDDPGLRAGPQTSPALGAPVVTVGELGGDVRVEQPLARPLPSGRDPPTARLARPPPALAAG